jgi:hypothetical protein
MKRRSVASTAPTQGTVAPLDELRGGQREKRSQKAVWLHHEAVRHEMLAEIADQDGEVHTGILSAVMPSASTPRLRPCSRPSVRPGGS